LVREIRFFTSFLLYGGRQDPIGGHFSSFEPFSGEQIPVFQSAQKNADVWLLFYFPGGWWISSLCRCVVGGGRLPWPFSSFFGKISNPYHCLSLLPCPPSSWCRPFCPSIPFRSHLLFQGMSTSSEQKAFLVCVRFPFFDESKLSSPHSTLRRA